MVDLFQLLEDLSRRFGSPGPPTQPRVIPATNPSSREEIAEGLTEGFVESRIVDALESLGPEERRRARRGQPVEISEAKAERIRQQFRDGGVEVPDFNTFLSIGLDKCAPSGQGSGRERNRVFQELTDLWNREKDSIKGMSEAELRRQLNCP